MANPGFTTIQINPTLYNKAENRLLVPMLEDDGVTPLDVSGFNTVHVDLNVDVGGGQLLNVGTLSKIPTFTTPNDVFDLSVADMATLAGDFSGTFLISIYGKNLTGDDLIQLAVGTAFVSQAYAA
jgi:hypothetical protein